MSSQLDCDIHKVLESWLGHWSKIYIYFIPSHIPEVRIRKETEIDYVCSFIRCSVSPSLETGRLKMAQKIMFISKQLQSRYILSLEYAERTCMSSLSWSPQCWQMTLLIVIVLLWSWWGRWQVGISPQSCTKTDFEMKTSNFALFLLISVVSVHFRAIYDEIIRCQA